MKKIAIIMGSDSDLPVLEGAIKTLAQFGVPAEVRVLSAHRTPLEAAQFAREAREKGLQRQPYAPETFQSAAKGV